MSTRNRLRIAARLGALFTVAIASTAQPAAANGSLTCDRACLRRSLDGYLSAVFQHDPAAAPLADGYRGTENAVDTPNGQGFWKTFSGYGALQRRYFDPVYETAAFLGVLRQAGQDVIVSLRIRVADRKVSEAEWIIPTQGPGGHGQADVAGLLRNPPPSGVLPASQRSSRFLMISLANDYFQALQDHDGSWVPHDPTCNRIENGVKTTFGPPIAPIPGAGGHVSAGAFGKLSGSCLDDFAIFRHNIAELSLRRFPVVDQEAGVVLGSTIFIRYPGVPEPRNLVDEYFYVRGGRIRDIWTAMYYLPKTAPLSSGWEDR